MFFIIVLKVSRPYVFTGISNAMPRYSEKIGDSVFFNDFDVAVKVCENIQNLDSSVFRAVPLNVHSIGHLLVSGFRHFLEEHENDL